MERRSALKNLGGLLLAPSLTLGSDINATKKPVLRVAHLTDIHLKNKFDAPKRFVNCLHHVQKQSPKVDFILNGGDIVFDMNKENIDVINAQWKLMKDTLKADCNLPVHYCLGNHDIWWNENNKGQAVYGKQYSLDQLQLTKSYSSMIKGGWKFIILDSVHLDVDNTWYIGKLGDEQFNWLQKELEQTDKNMPILVMSHIPILTATNLIEDNIINRWTMYGGDMHTDTTKIISLFYKHPNVKLCLSGHIHLREKLVYNNVTYICDGAVSGAWWEGNRRETAPVYGLLDLYADGSFEERYVNY
ncbi:metallophosphoesterase family protein [Mucilaginibacter myungsuensis]|uniref:Metallophosphoesterase n=1 Tax=Mucilaginibacter myungsuensis TaxID=649104 RepID=A0A929KZ49_9SPHI|nr:metallophosphoesterase [Mucilaginibacter myungsuensis]MBE9663302.1 metallophosphoesterase [Mucilaginibacter myungsuensis]MDN3600037.1 metallophosphoesterase [Mucilaginibacter myungsuensis]